MRSFALAALAAFSLCATAAASPPAGRTEFEVLRNGQPFGRHVVVVSGAGDDLRVQSSVALRAMMGPLTVYRLDQTCSETWRDGSLAVLRCTTTKDGRRTHVSADMRDNRLRVVGEGEHWFPAGAFPTSWWTMPPQGATLINTETGEALRARVTHAGRETIDVGGERIEAQRVRIQGSLTADLWYDAQGRWVACAFTARGQHIQYRLATPLGAAPA